MNLALHNNKPREQWASRTGFILAAMGSAVGLGNIWRFSYVAGESGGGAFLLIYLLCILIIGIPIIMAEFTIGRRSQQDVVGSFESLSSGGAWRYAGLLGVTAAFMILSFYAVISGWIMHYFIQYLNGSFWTAPAEGYEGYFVSFTGSFTQSILWHFLFMALVIIIVMLGVKKGIELSNKILMPLLGVLLIVLAGYSLTLGGAAEGLSFLFTPDWSAFSDPAVYLAAMGQAFFSLSLGMGTMITYGSYLSKKEQLPGAAFSVAGLDTGFAILAGVMIFPAVFAFGIDPSSGPGLVFMVLPDIFNNIAAGGIVGLGFFFLLAAAALSSAISILEVAVAFFMRKFNWSRIRAALVIGTIIFLIGIPSSLGFGPWAGVTIIGENGILDSIDFIASNILLPLGGLIIALFVGWSWKTVDALRESDFGQTTIGYIWLFILRFIAPIAILLIFLSSIGLF
ncbi:NSS family neurotransmitter:Na+ symporter [Sinobaca qinghaiensis]|uniref:NSS family neurotransmitter:Na+ symporter n=1 Tax=Sinobaca qinghaiensis TaxID=342944 RepID=A0A419UZY7_9BACL|nr:NSS family neurotransmitter:Na+ symporter [Sinobaca qinghaiensis]